jgi:ribosome-associated toxin RatA of RatAB toxin-antitoxin module
MPIQQSVDVGVSVRKVYDAWTQYEEWPRFMHRVESVDQSDETTVGFSTKTWGITKRFEAKVAEAHPDERIEWNVEQGLSHTGVVTFHKLSDRLTRIEVTVDVEPDSLLEKAGRGMRYAKRAVRGDLHRFKAYVELYEEEIEKGWRGTIEDGEVKRRTERKPSSKRSRGARNGGSKSRSGSGSRSRSSGGSSSRSRRRSGGGTRSGSRSSS